MIQNKNKFVKVGFEFTAAVKPTLLITNPKLSYEIRWPYNEETIVTKEGWATDTSELPWIRKNFQSDDCGCEIPTPIITKKSDIEKYYNQFMDFVNRSNLTTDINQANNSLGAGHIHLDLSYLERDIKVSFLKNIGIFMTNNPWLNWALNDPNDNINANSMAGNCVFKKVTDSAILFPDKKSKKFKNAKTPLDIFLIDPLNTLFIKKFAVRYNSSYDTVELRIFDMPNTLEEHLFHYECAMAIYNYCLDVAVSDMEIGRAIHDSNSYMFLDKKFVIMFLKQAFDRIGIIPSQEQFDKMLFNIDTRYRWSHTRKILETGDIIHKDFYLF